MKIPILFRDISIVVGAVVVGGAIMYGIVYYQQIHNKQNTVLAAQTEANTLLEQVGKLMILPKEVPTIATVSDVTKLKDQPFFTQAKNGDKVLIYVQAKEAILYRPDINKLVQVAPLNLQISPTPIKSGPTPSSLGSTGVQSGPTPFVIKVKATETPIPTLQLAH